MRSLTRKIIIISFLTSIPLILIYYKNFIYFRKGWHVAEIQYNTIFWLIRLLLCPLIVFTTVRFWNELNKLFLLLATQLACFIFYTLAFWSASFFFGRFTSGFDGRSRNLFNIIKGGSFVQNILVYTVTAFIVYLWTYFENNREIIKKINTLETSLTGLKQTISHYSKKEKTQQDDKLDKLTIKNGYKTTILSVQEIIYFLSAGPYVRAVTNTGVHLISKPLYELQSVLPAAFLRVHRSHIVNKECIKEARSLLNGDYTLVLKNGTELRASRTYRQSLKDILDKM
jgi:DNA-binding LytR/AlgR family response regulator